MTQLQFSVIPADPVAFRPIHYLGSKLRLASSVRHAVERIGPHGVLCDLFAGSGTISLTMAQLRPVVSVDIQEYSRVLCSALLSPPSEVHDLGSQVSSSARRSELFSRLGRAMLPLLEYEEHCTSRAIAGDLEPLYEFVEHGSLTWFAQTGADPASQTLRRALRQTATRLRDDNLSSAPGSLVTRYFGGAYFSFRQSTELDALLDVAQSLHVELRDAGLAPILSTASEIVNTIGKHFAQPIRPRARDGKPKRHLVRRMVVDRAYDTFAAHRAWVERYSNLPRTAGPHKAIRDDFRAFLATKPVGISVFYADPPYTRDHYSRFYHVLETMCLRDEPRVSRSMIRTGGKPRVSRGFYRTDRHQSPFCIKSLAPGAFEALFDGVRQLNTPLVLSYSPFDETNGGRPRLLSVRQIANLARRRFRQVEISSPGPFAHSKLNIQDLNRSVSWEGEVLLICVP